jgi:hypothetical protein
MPIRHVLQENGQRLARFDIAEPFEIEPRPLVVNESARMIVDFPELRPANAREGPTRRPSNDDVEGIGHGLQTQLGGECFRRRANVAGPGMLQRPAMKIDAMRAGGIGLILDRGGNLESRCLKAKRKPTAASEQVKDARPCTALNSLDLSPDRLGHLPPLRRQPS